MKKLLKEFKAFITRGNVFDLAIAVIIGGAFSKIVTSLVNDIIMPVITMIVGKSSLAEFALVFTRNADGTVANALRYGTFIQTIIDFLLIAIIIFIMFKILSSARGGISKIGKKKKNAEVAEPVVVEPPKPTADELLLEIRDLLKAQAIASGTLATEPVAEQEEQKPE